jgi:hypothetical protein
MWRVRAEELDQRIASALQKPRKPLAKPTPADAEQM